MTQEPQGGHLITGPGAQASTGAKGTPSGLSVENGVLSSLGRDCPSSGQEERGSLLQGRSGPECSKSRDFSNADYNFLRVRDKMMG